MDCDLASKNIENYFNDKTPNEVYEDYFLIKNQRKFLKRGISLKEKADFTKIKVELYHNCFIRVVYNHDLWEEAQLKKISDFKENFDDCILFFFKRSERCYVHLYEILSSNIIKEIVDVKID